MTAANPVTKPSELTEHLTLLQVLIIRCSTNSLEYVTRLTHNTKTFWEDTFSEIRIIIVSYKNVVVPLQYTTTELNSLFNVVVLTSEWFSI